MRFYYIVIYATAIVGICAALPIPSARANDRNVFIIGALAFLSFGAIITGCVCCKRRKKGFEEFTNESGTLEANKSEYPIFRALADTDRLPDVENANNVAVVNASNENLIADDADNNNGPISPADLENIENNNAVDYIRNQNEIGIVIEPPPIPEQQQPQQQQPPRNRNEAPIELGDVEIHVQTRGNDKSEEKKTDDEQKETAVLQDAVVSSTTDSMVADKPEGGKQRGGTNEEGNSGAIVHQLKNENLINRLSTTEDDHVPIPNGEAKIISKEETVGDNDLTIIKTMTTETIVRPEAVVVEIEIEKDEAGSVRSNSSNKTTENSSVEEALRALDNALENEEFMNNYGDEMSDNDDDDLTDEEFCPTPSDFQNVLKDLLINNGMSEILPKSYEGNFEKIQQKDSREFDEVFYAEIRSQAKEFVDDILNQSLEIAARREAADQNNTICVQNLEILKTDFIKDTERMQEEQGAESFDDFFANELLAKTSTPCVQNKFAVSSSKSKFSHKMLFNEDNLNSPLIEAVNDATFDGNIPRIQIGLDGTFDKNSPMFENNATFDANSPQNQNVNNATFDGVAPIQQDLKNNATFDSNSPQVLPTNATFDANSPQLANATFDLNDRTYDANHVQNDFTYPGDPCTSKQAIERDQVLVIKCNQRDEVTSEELNTITPVNTPIELNYNQETWDKMTRRRGSEEDASKNGWFLHPQGTCDDHNDEEKNEEENEENLELTFEALRKQLAEVLPQPQGMAGPLEFSDDEDEAGNNRTFDEYRSPLDGIFGLLEIDSNTQPEKAQNEMVINYKRSLSPILEESEEETCKTFAVNETKILDNNSTSTGCVETSEAIMGVTKTLMASNDTLFNFEDTLGDKEDGFSPRIPSRNTSEATTPVKSNRTVSVSESVTLSNGTDKVDGDANGDDITVIIEKKTPPKTIEFVDSSQVDNDLCSPDQQKTFSEGTTTSSTTDRLSSDVSPTLDNEATFTANTNDDKTCVTVIIKDDERISEISEPEWGSNAAQEDTNSLADIPSLDFREEINQNLEILDENSPSSLDTTVEKSSGQDDSGHSTQASTATDNKSNTSHNISAPETDSNEEPHDVTSVKLDDDVALDSKDNCTRFITNEIEFATKGKTEVVSKHTNKPNNNNRMDSAEHFKENADPNAHKLQQQHQQPLSNGIVVVSQSSTSPSVDERIASYPKVQINSQDAVIIDKTKTNHVTSSSVDCLDTESAENVNRFNDKFTI